jgi:hypothetical protein
VRQVGAVRNRGVVRDRSIGASGGTGFGLPDAKVTKGSGSKAAGLAMAFKLIEAAQGRWRAVNAPHLVALVRNGAVFKKGKLVERSTARGLTETAA